MPSPETQSTLHKSIELAKNTAIGFILGLTIGGAADMVPNYWHNGGKNHHTDADLDTAKLTYGLDSQDSVNNTNALNAYTEQIGYVCANLLDNYVSGHVLANTPEPDAVLYITRTKDTPCSDDPTATLIKLKTYRNYKDKETKYETDKTTSFNELQDIKMWRDEDKNSPLGLFMGITFGGVVPISKLFGIARTKFRNKLHKRMAD